MTKNSIYYFYKYTFAFVICSVCVLSGSSPKIYGQSSDIIEVETLGAVDFVFDSLNTALNKEQNDTTKIRLLNEISWHLTPLDVDKSIVFADSAIKISEKNNYKLGKGDALNNKGEALRNKGSFEEALKQHKLALEIFLELNDLKGEAKTESNIGIIYFNLSDFSQSFKHFDNSLDIYKILKNQDGILNVYGYIGVVFSNFKQHDKAIEYFEKALQIAKDLKKSSKIATQLNNLGLTFVEMKEYTKAISYYEKALEEFKKGNEDFNYSITLGNIGIPYMELKNYSMARKSFEESLALAVKLGDQYGVAHQYGNIGELYLKMEGDYYLKVNEGHATDYLNEAIRYLKLSINEFNSLGAIEDQKDYLIILSEAYALHGNYKSSLTSFKEAIELRDSIQAKENLKVTASLEIKQELENKEKEITILNQDKEYEAMLKTAITIFAFLVMFISLLILYFYKKKRKDNILLEKNIEIREEVEKTLRINEAELTKHKNNLEDLVKDRTKKLENEIIEHKQTEEALLMAVERAEVANNAKSVFLANMSHELRTPLVGILGYSDLLTSLVQDKDAKEMAEGINRTGNRLLTTLSLVLDLARIESDKFEIEIREVDVIKQVKETFQNFKGLAEKKNLKLILDVHTDKFYQSTDVGMLNVILDNLVNNAIKFTKEGEVKIITDIDYYENNPRLIIKVIDTGIGIQKKDIPLIFNEFKQLSEGSTKDFQGSGLGLSITKKFVDLLGGTILVDSEKGKGTSFTISFPAEIKAVA
ncbi:MAG: tetratricopeptide repeat protein [Ignavibacteriales bacterium]|nr:tetratricopeptide repeat protein [Ignavibacteriales bacterium]